MVFSLHDAVISQQEQMTYFSALGFEVGKSITVPTHRSDVDQLNDLAEEVTRMIGCNNISSQVLALKGETDEEYELCLKQTFRRLMFLLYNSQHENSFNYWHNWPGWIISG